MALKTQWQQNTHRALRLMGRLYRWAGWFGLGATSLGMVFAFISHWNLLSRGFGGDIFTKLSQSLVAVGIAMTFGLFVSGMAFLVSLFIEVGSRMMENSLLQTDLLQRLVREQSDHDENIPARLVESDSNDRALSDDLASKQTNHR